MVDNRLSGGSLIEADTKRCPHCQTIVILNPDRVRPRNYCPRHDSYICDKPECNVRCTDVDGILDEMSNRAVKGQPFIPFNELKEKPR